MYPLPLALCLVRLSVLSVVLVGGLAVSACGGSSSGSGSGSGSGSDSSDGSDNGNNTLRSDLSNAVLLLAAEEAMVSEADTNAVTMRTTEERALPRFRQATGLDRVQSQATTHGDSGDSESEAATNLLAIDEDGIASPAVEADMPVYVLFSVLGPSQDYLYLALDDRWDDGVNYGEIIDSTGCAIWRASVDAEDEQNEWECVAPDLKLGRFSHNFRNRNAGGEKPLMFDAKGNLYFLAANFADRADDARIHRVEAPDQVDSSDEFDIEALTQDHISVDFFLPLSDSTLVYSSGGSNLRFWQDGSTIDIGEHRGVFARGDGDTVLFRESNNESFRLARPAELGVLRAAVPLPNGAEHINEFSGDITFADDGGIYLVGNRGVLRILPYAEVPILKLNDWSWGDLPVLLSKGHILYVEEVDVDFLGAADVIRLQRMNDSTMSTALDPEAGSNRYRLSSWQIQGDTLHFAAEDLTESMFVMGELDLIGLQDGEPMDDVLTIAPAASAAGAIAEIRDMQMVRPAKPEVDTGHTPEVMDVHHHGEDPYTAGIQFSKFMNHDSVEDGLSLCCIADTNTEVSWMPFWHQQTLHLALDQEHFASVDNKPLDFGHEYQLTLEEGVRDAWNWQVEDESQETLSIRPESGVYLGDPVGAPPSPAVAEGGNLRVRGTQILSDSWLKDPDSGEPLQLDEPYRIEFSTPGRTVAVRFGYPGDRLQGSVRYHSYYSDRFDVERWSNRWGVGPILTHDVDLPTGGWIRIAIERFAESLRVGYLDEDEAWVWPEELSVDLMEEANFDGSDNYYQLALHHPDGDSFWPVVMDNLQITPLTYSGEPIPDAVPLLDLLTFDDEEDLQVISEP